MLKAMDGHTPPAELPPARVSAAIEAQAVWIDMDNASEAERAQVSRATGLRVPERQKIEEIENSSRLANQGGVLFLSTPMVTRGADGRFILAPVGFVLSKDRLLTIRFASSLVFDRFTEAWRCDHASDTARGVQPFLGLLEALVDRLADVLEQMGAETDALSTALFAQAGAARLSSRKRDAFLQATLADIGTRGARVSQLRDGLLGIGRIVGYVADKAADWLVADDTRRLTTLAHDVTSLTDYDAQLTSKVHFLLDATLGFINIEQNNTIKVLTVVSIVGIPPTFIASLYGMNFHNMPELGWKYGYQYGLTLIALSIAVPLLLFWRRGWL